MWWLLSLPGMTVRGKDAAPGAVLGSANKVLKKAAAWKANAKKSATATTHAATNSHHQQKLSLKQ